MKQKVIICGAGRVGTSITEHLSNEGFDITVIDSNSEAIQRITELYDVQGVLGLASYPNVLEDAGIVDTDLIIAVTQSDEINIAACHVAKSIFGTPTMIIRIRSKEYLDPKYSNYLLKDVGVNRIISPEMRLQMLLLINGEPLELLMLLSLLDHLLLCWVYLVR